ncbi:MAG: plasmid stabilization protein [Bryobacteraceae bacterium]
MASITIRKMEESLKAQLRLRAARNGRSMEEEAREILRASLRLKQAPKESLVDAIRRHVAPIGGVELELPPRGPMRPPPSFE